MGRFVHPVQVFTPPGEPIEGVEAWVDTGSTYTWLPRALIERALVGELEQREFILANGQRERRDVAQVRISLGRPQFFTYCAFSEPGEELLLGAAALVEAGLAVDPVNRRLVPTAGYALTAISRSP